MVTRRKLLLVAPAWPDRLRKRRRRKSLFPPLNLGLVAALTPPAWDVRIVDESVENLDFELEVDLVGLTAMTAMAPRAYEIAARFRQRGIPVVMGGIHASTLPGEAVQHVDAVVAGEAELTWPLLLDDFEHGRLKQLYRSPGLLPDLSRIPIPRRSLFKQGAYLLTNTIQTTRGCPFDCDFCTVTKFYGQTYRTRPLESVLREIDALKGKTVLFVDDNIVGNPGYAQRLFKALIPYKLRWIGQSSLTIARNDELLDLAAASGCQGLFIGFESLSPENLASVKKGKVNRVGEYEQAIKRIHSRGIGIEGAFIFGFDYDDQGVFQRTVAFAQRMRLEAAQFGILTPFPGTPLRSVMEKAGRICDHDWSKYTISHVVHWPQKMSRATLLKGFVRAYRDFYSVRSILRRLLGRLKPSRGFLFFLPLNMVFRQISAQLGRRKADRELFSQLAEPTAGMTFAEINLSRGGTEAYQRRPQ